MPTDETSIAYMPFAEYSDSFRLGNVSFHPFNESLLSKGILSKSTYEEMRPFADQFIKRCLISREGDTIRPNVCKGTIIAYHDKIPDFSGDEDTEYPKEEIRDTVLLLSLLSTWDLFPYIVSGLIPSNFQVYEISLRRGAESGYITDTSGWYIRSAITGRTNLFINTEPRGNISSFLGGFAHLEDEKFFHGAHRALEDFANVSRKSWWRQLARSIRVANLSLLNVEEVKYFDMVLLLVTAYQILIGSDSQNGSKIARAMRGLLRGSSRVAPESTASEDGDDCLRFFKEIYRLRSRYSHGNELDDSASTHGGFGEYYNVGRYAFGLACKALLRREGYIIEDRRDYAFDLLCAMNNSRSRLAFNRRHLQESE